MLKFQILRWFVIISVAAALIYFKETHGLAQDVNTLLNNLMHTASILSGIVIAYVLAKIYQLSQDKLQDQEHIDQLSSKLSNYRKLLFRLMKSPDFWIKYDDIKLVKTKYPKLSFNDLHDEDNASAEVDAFWSDEHNFSSTTADLYLAMEAVTGPVEDIEEIEEHKEAYSVDYLKRIQPALNQIWFYLEEKYAKHTAGLINDQGIWEPYHDSIRNLCIRIDHKQKRKEFDRTTVAEMASNFVEEHIPNLLRFLLKKKNRITRSLVSLIITLTVMISAGTLIPLSAQLFPIHDADKHNMGFWCATLLICAVFNLIFELGLLLFRDFIEGPKK